MSGHDPAAEDLIALIPQQFICLGIHFQVENKNGKSHMVTIHIDSNRVVVFVVRLITLSG